MPVCKYFLQGTCRYGDKCYNEHPRGAHQQRWAEDEYSDRNYQRTSKSRSYNNNQQNSYSRDNNYQSNHDYGYQQQSHTTRSYQQHNQNESHRTNLYDNSGGGNSRTPKQDKYHWTNENRYAALEEENKPDTDVNLMLSTIQADIKIWAESKMWAFSCYSPQDNVACIDGLPDISPEEMRVLSCLHPSKYRDIMSEIEATYCKTKDELFQMNDTTKSNLISQMHMLDSNPSQHLKIAALYGPEFNFENKEEISPSVITKNAPVSQVQNSFTVPSQTNVSPSVVGVPSPLSFDTTKMPAVEKTQNISVFGSSLPNTSSQISTVDEVYTNIELLTDDEKKKFVAERFAIGEIPIRPPAENYCR